MAMDVYIYQYRESSTIEAYGITNNDATVRFAIAPFIPSAYIEFKSKVDQALIRREVASIKGVVHAEWVRRPALRAAATNEFLRVTAPRMILHRMASQLSTGTFAGKLCGMMHELNVATLTQFLTQRGLEHTGWVCVHKARPDPDFGSGDLAGFKVAPQFVEPLASHRHVPPIRVLAFDIEAYSSKKNRMPDASCAEDRVFQISTVTSTGDKCIHTLGTVDTQLLDPDVKVIQCDTESILLRAFATTLNKYNPHIVTGYNIFGFDMPYLHERAVFCKCDGDLLATGIGYQTGTLTNVSWSSTAFRAQNFTYIDMPGRIVIDLMSYAQREMKLENYRLATLAKQVLGDTVDKDPLTPHGIFAAYRVGVLHKPPRNFSGTLATLGTQLLTACAAYCIKDAELTLKTYDKLDMTTTLLQMSAVLHVPAVALYTQGQQSRVFSLLYRECYKGRVVFNVDKHNRQQEQDDTDDTGFTGAYVFPPVPGVYKNVVPFDFASLYPSTIIRYNVCYSTVAPPDVPDEDCHIISFEEHIGCECPGAHAPVRGSAVVCRKTRQRYLREPQGLLPRLLQNLLAARASTRVALKAETDSGVRTILDKRQLAIKVASNSVYGSLGVRNGALSFLDGAASVTAWGRQNIQMAAQWLQENAGATLVYGDTDSCYLQFLKADGSPWLPRDLWDHCLDVECRVNQALFLPPMKLTFEEAIYQDFLILSKKRYACTKIGSRDADRPSDKLAIRGLLLTRRDNARVMRTMYEKLIRGIFAGWDHTRVLHEAVDYVRTHVYGCAAPFADFVVTKSVGEIASYKSTTLPAHVQLAERMRRRGEEVAAGSRMEFVFVMPPGASHKDKLNHRVESAEFAQRHRDVLPLDTLHYVSLMVSPVDELLVALGAPPKQFEKFWKQRIAYSHAVTDTLARVKKIC